MVTCDQAWRVPARPSEIRGVRHDITRLVVADHLTDLQVADVALAVSEAASNVVRHAFPDDRPGMIELHVVVDAMGVVVVVRDDGVGRGSPSADPGAGLGLSIIASLADEVAQTPRPDGGTEVRMRFLSAGPGAPRLS